MQSVSEVMLQDISTSNLGWAVSGTAVVASSFSSSLAITITLHLFSGISPCPEKKKKNNTYNLYKHIIKSEYLYTESKNKPTITDSKYKIRSERIVMWMKVMLILPLLSFSSTDFLVQI